MCALDQHYNLPNEDPGPALDASRKIRVLIVDDHAGVRAGIRSLLLAAADMIVIEEGTNGHEAISLTQSHLPDIVLLDIEMPGLRGDMVARWIHDTLPAIKVLAVTSYNDSEYVKSMLESGAAGYITKDEAPAVLLEAIRSIIIHGNGWFGPGMYSARENAFNEEQTLTQRELDILKHLKSDRTPGEIAHLIGMDEKRVANYLDLLMKKFGVESLSALRPIAHRVLKARGI